MRIGLDWRCVRPWPTGLGRYARRLLMELAGGPDRLWAVMRTGETPAIPAGVQPVPTRHGVEDHLLGDPWFHLVLPDRLRRLRLDLFHGPAGAIPSSGRGLRRVVTIHDLAVIRHPETNRRRFVWYTRGVLRAAAGRADLVLTDSEFVRQEVIQQYRLSPERVRAIPLGAEPPPANAGGGDDLPESPYVLSVANREPRKNLPRLLEAWSRLPAGLAHSRRLILAGATGWKTQAFEEALERLPVERRPVLVGRVDESTLWRLYRGAELFVMPSLYEGFGLPALEAMSVGCPVLLARAASLPEVGGEAAAYFDPLDVGDLAGRLEALLDDPEERARLAEAGRTRAAELTWARTAGATREAYESVL